MAHKFFLNLPVKDLARSKAFWSKLGFAFNPQFTDDKAACMILSDEAFVMLLTEPFFRTFTKRDVCDAHTHTEALFALSCDSRAAVDAMVRTALESGGSLDAPAPDDHGFMYSWSFLDPDGHGWGPLWMDPGHVQNPEP